MIWPFTQTKFTVLFYRLLSSIAVGIDGIDGPVDDFMKNKHMKKQKEKTVNASNRLNRVLHCSLSMLCFSFHSTSIVNEMRYSRMICGCFVLVWFLHFVRSYSLRISSFKRSRKYDGIDKHKCLNQQSRHDHLYAHVSSDSRQSLHTTVLLNV